MYCTSIIFIIIIIILIPSCSLLMAKIDERDHDVFKAMVLYSKQNINSLNISILFLFVLLSFFLFSFPIQFNVIRYQLWILLFSSVFRTMPSSYRGFNPPVICSQLLWYVSRLSIIEQSLGLYLLILTIFFPLLLYIQEFFPWKKPAELNWDLK